MAPVLNGVLIAQIGYHAQARDIDTHLLIQNSAREALQISMINKADRHRLTEW